MGWLRLVGSIKLQVSFAKYHLFYRALLQKRPIILRSLLIAATPYIQRYIRLSEMNLTANKGVRLYLYVYVHLYVYTGVFVLFCSLVKTLNMLNIEDNPDWEVIWGGFDE